MTEIALAKKTIETWMDLKYWVDDGNRWATGFLHALISENGQRNSLFYICYRTGMGKYFTPDEVEEIWPSVELLITTKQQAIPRINCVRIHLLHDGMFAYDYLSELTLSDEHTRLQLEGYDPAEISLKHRLQKACSLFLMYHFPYAFEYSVFKFYRIGGAVSAVFTSKDLIGRLHTIEHAIDHSWRTLLIHFWEAEKATKKNLLEIRIDGSFSFQYSFMESYVLDTIEKGLNFTKDQ